ncbi:hypothetical protein ACQPW1_39300 [Nocardia sp. CA-128927]|uniref:hypothetical protein n=1 Tax=Nocardia sp. CA-128927 TaxID=3239975 RepID=UPI003D998555
MTPQVVITLGGLAGFAANIPTIIDDLAQLPNRLTAHARSVAANAAALSGSIRSSARLPRCGHAPRNRCRLITRHNWAEPNRAPSGWQ